MENETDVRKKYFRAVKKSYRRGPFFEKIKSAKPNWKAVEQYTEEELAFLIHLDTGHTWQQFEERKEFYAQSNIDMPSDLFAKKMKLSWKDFIKALSDRTILKEAMQKEEELVKVHKKAMF